MSLKGVEFRMLGIERQHGEYGETEPGADPGILAGQPSGAVLGDATGGEIPMRDANARTLGEEGTGHHNRFQCKRCCATIKLQTLFTCLEMQGFATWRFDSVLDASVTMKT